jgi:H/ACA ribonucleoprotein complex subunit 3
MPEELANLFKKKIKMALKIFKCGTCENYTLKKTCSKCNKKTDNPKPAKFSPEDKFGKYRRLAKKEK